MSNRILLSSFALAAALCTAGCAHKPVAETNVHTTTVTKDDQGVKKSDISTTTTDNADGTQTTKTDASSVKTTPSGR